MSNDTVQLDDGRIVDLQSEEGGRWLASQPEADRNAILARMGSSAQSQPNLSDLMGSLAQSYATKEIGNSLSSKTTSGPGLFSITSNTPNVFGANAGYAPGLAGAAGLYDLSQNRERIGHGSGYLEGMASGAGIGFTVGGPIGAGIGAGIGLLGNALGIGHKSATKLEEKHRQALADRGIIVPNSDIKEWENNAKFADSRNEADLTGKDIIHAAQLYDIPGYAKANASTQEAIANEALKQKLIREEHGQIDVTHNAGFDEFVKNQLAAKPEATTTPRPTTTSNNSEKKKEKKTKLDLSQIAPVTEAPRYDINLNSIYRNPYL